MLQEFVASNDAAEALTLMREISAPGELCGPAASLTSALRTDDQGRIYTRPWNHRADILAMPIEMRVNLMQTLDAL